MISMHNSVGGPRLGLQDDRLAVLCDSSIVRAVHAKLPLDVACDGNKLLAAAAVLARLFGRILNTAGRPPIRRWSCWSRVSRLVWRARRLQR